MQGLPVLLSLILFLTVQSRPVKLWHLKDTNIDKAKEQTPILLLYHRYNDTNSTELLPALKEAITRMEEFGINAGEINCTKYPKTCKNHGVKKGSVLKFLPHRGSFNYKGELNADGIYEWVEKSQKKALRLFRTYDEAAKLFEGLESVFIGWFSDRKNIEFVTYESCASSPKENSLYLAVVNHTIDSPKIEYRNLLEDWNEKFDGQWTWVSLTRWMSDVQSPFVDEITSENAERFHKTKTPCGYIIYDGRTDDIENMRKLGTKVGKQFRKQVLPVLLDHSKHSKVAETLGLSASMVPGFTIVAPFDSYDEEAKAHYPMYTDPPASAKADANGVTPYSFVDDLWHTRHSSIDLASVSAHVQAFVEHRLPLPIRSQPASVTDEALLDQSRAVIPVTGATFNRTALDLEKNVFMLFQTPWCSKCKRLNTQFEALARDVRKADADLPEQNRSRLLFATFDATENDVWPYYRVDEYPTLLLFNRGDKTHAKRCNETESIERIKEFLHKHIHTFPITPDAQILAEEDERQKKREKMEKKMGLDKKKKKYLFEDEL